MEKSRNEAILENLLGANNPIIPPISRIEKLLISILQAGMVGKLKATDQMAWIGRMNNIRRQADEIILTELIYG